MKKRTWSCSGDTYQNGRSHQSCQSGRSRQNGRSRKNGRSRHGRSRKKLFFQTKSSSESLAVQ